MPYIPTELRQAALSKPFGSGELNYKLTVVILEYWEYMGHQYSTINDIVGALEGVKAEFQRRVVAPYEDQKIKENGDAY